MLENNGTRGALPACATQGCGGWLKSRVIVNLNLNKQSMLMMAYAQGLPIYVYGSGQCASGNEVVSDIGFGG
ncbi:MAG: hypothetical protein V4525_03565 [Pseudomonadota bacterium]